MFDQSPCEMSSTRSKLDDHVGDHVFLSLGGVVLLTSRTEMPNPPPPSDVERYGIQRVS